MACRLRDEDMVDLGVLIEDDGNESVWKLDDPAVLRAEARCNRHSLVPVLSSLPCSAYPAAWTSTRRPLLI